ncbi:hypothetical protein OQB66_03180 [Pseudomonas syringae]|uniref:hypothetical protein n=1 Tax=Pseudomonas syringae TaxID=317 RepID=UPI00224AA17F|nr:hypothetical protein [Pseudomonas syringae]UZS73359.1 hypothetical protein OQB66_03180 [Pseudomonas syringae]
MGTPLNYSLKGKVDDSKPGLIETLHYEGFSSEPAILATHTLSPGDVYVLIERLYWTSIDGTVDYTTGPQQASVVLTYPFTTFWNAITNYFAIAQYSEEYSIRLRMELVKGLKLDNKSKYPHLVRICLAGHQWGEEFSKIQIEPHNGKVSSFECRAEIIAHATYIQGMLYKIISDSKKPTPKPLAEMSYHQMISFCMNKHLLKSDTVKVLRHLKDLRNEAAHQFSFEVGSNGHDFMSVEPVSRKLMKDLEKFVAICEKRYKLQPARINRFSNSARLLAGELNKKAKLAQHVVLGKQYPTELATYFYG